jgi:long-chain fatty acid transport protein
VRSLPQAQPRFVNYDNRPQRIVITTSFAFEVVEELFVGLGLTYMTDTRGTVDMLGIVNLTSTDLTTLHSAVDVEFAATRYPTVGLRYTPGEHWRFGLTYRHEYTLALALDLEVRGDITLSEEQLLLVDGGAFLFSSLNTNLFSPRQLAFGVAYTEERWTISADLSWLEWSRFRAPVSAIDLELDLGDLEFDVPLPSKPLAPGFSDILVPRIGGEFVIVDDPGLRLAARAGYFFESSPAPAQQGITNYVDGDKHGFSLGLGLEVDWFAIVLPQPMALDLAGQLIVLPEHVTLKDDPADVVGDYRAGGTVMTFAATMGFPF